MGTFIKKQVKKRAIKLPVAVLVCALLVVGGGIIAYKAVAVHTVTVAVTPTEVDINQVFDLQFDVTKNTGSLLGAIKIYYPSDFSYPNSITCPTEFKTSEINESENYVKCAMGDTGSSISAGTVILNSIGASSNFGEKSFTVETSDVDYDKESVTKIVTVKDLSATAIVTPITTNTNQTRIYGFTVTNDGGTDSDSIAIVTINVPSGFVDISVVNPTNWTCSYTSPAITCTAGSGSELADGSSLLINATATALNTTGATIWNVEAVGSLGGSVNPTTQPTITVQIPPSISEITTTISPDSVSQGQAGVSFSVNVENTGEASVTLNTGSTISFTDETITYSATLSSATTIAGGAIETLVFSPASISAGMLNKSYNPDLALLGTDSNTAGFTQTVNTANNPITVQTPASLSVGDINSDVLAISKNSSINTATVSIYVANSGEATAVMNSVTVQIFDQAGTPNDISTDFTINRTDGLGNDINGSETLTYTIVPKGSETYEGLVNVGVTIDYKDKNTGLPLSPAVGYETGIFRIDNTSPTISGIVIDPNLSPTNNNTPTITFNVSDDGIGVDLSSVKIFDGTNYHIPACTAGACSYTFASALADDTYTFTISASDNVGNLASDGSLAGYVIDTVKPDTSDNAPTGWQKTDVTITLTPSDSDPSSVIAWTKYCTDTDNTCDPTTEGTSLTILDEGTTYFRYASADLAGNVQDTVSRVVMIDKSVPIIPTITSPSNSDYIKGIVTINATATDNAGGSGIEKVEFYHGTTKIGEDTDSPYSVDWDTNSVTDNTVYSLTAKAIDQAGNPLTSSAISVTVDNTPPTIVTYTIINPEFSPNGDTVKDVTNIDLLFSEPVDADVNILNSLGVKVKDFYDSSGYVTNPNAKDWDGKNNSDVVVADGVYTIEVIITDRAGSSLTDKTETVVVDNTLPQVDAGQDRVTNNSVAQDDATASDGGSGIESYLWEKTAGPGTLTFVTDNILNPTISADTNGDYTAQLTITDKAGNTNSDTMNFTQDTVDPVINEILAPVADGVYRGNVGLIFTASDPVPGTALTYQYDIDGALISQPISFTSGTQVTDTINVSGVSEGRHTLTLTIVDEAGNFVNQTTSSFVIDNNSTLTVGDSNEDFDNIQEAIDKALAGDIIEVSDGDYNEGSITVDKNLIIKGNQAGVSAVNRIGEESIVTGQFAITTDNVTLDGFKLLTGFALTGVDKSCVYMLADTSGHTIENNVIIGDNESGARGILFGYTVNNTNVSGNDISGWHSGIYINPSSNLTFSNNYFHDNVVGIGSDGLSNVTVSNNIFEDNSVEGWGSSNVGINVSGDHNKFINTGAAVAHYGGNQINAELNWWGTYVESEIQALTPGDVDYNPWYMDEEMTTLSSEVSLSDVYVDDDYNKPTCEAAGYYWGYNCYAKIQEGIDNVTGSTVNVAAGTYSENININKQLTIQGADITTTIIDGAGTDSDVVSITANDVTLNGFTIQNANGGTVAGIRMDGRTGCSISHIAIKDITGATYAFGIYGAGMNLNTFSDIEISNLTEIGYNGVHGVWGIWLDSSDNNIFSTFNIHNLIAESDAQGVMLFHGSDGNELTAFTIDNLESTGGGYPTGISVYGEITTPSINNIFTNFNISNIIASGASTFSCGLQDRGNTGSVYTNINVSNLVSPTNQWVYGMAITSGSKVTITGGSIQLVDNSYDRLWGVSVWSDGSGVDINGVSISGAQDGIHIRDAVDATFSEVRNSSISGNTEYGINHAGTNVFDAKFNWWGSDEGPMHASNFYGDGNKVSNNVSFVPWCIGSTCAGDDIDETAPTAVLPGDPVNPISDKTISLTVSGDQVIYYKYKLDSGAYGDETVLATPITESSLAEGEHTISVIGRDQAGNWQAEADATTYTWTVDTIPPQAPDITFITNPINIANPTMTITGTGEPNTIVNYSIDDYDNATTDPVIGTSIVSSEGDINITGIGVSTLTDGVLTVSVTLTDAADNESGPATDTVNKDMFAPSFEIAYYADSGLTILADDYIKAGTYYIKVSANEPLSSVPTISIDAEGTNNDVAGGNAVSLGGNDYKYERTIVFDEAAVGVDIEEITVAGIDVAGNTGIEVKNGRYTDAIAPEIINLTPTYIIPDAKSPISADFSEEGSGVDVDSIKIVIDNEDETAYVLAMYKTESGVIYKTEDIIGALTEGKHYVTVEVADNLGNSSSVSWDFRVNSIYNPDPICTELQDDQWTCDISLNQGWNLISSPVVVNSNIASILSDISTNVNIVWYYESNAWYFYDPANTSGSTFDTMKDGEGYWVYMKNADTLTLTGLANPVMSDPPSTPSSYNVNLSDWNLIGFRSVNDMVVDNYVKNYINDSLNKDYIIWKYENGISLEHLNKESEMKPGYGYWLYME